MFRSRSFTLVKEKFKYTDLRWARFLIIPGLVAFSLLLVLWNVKYPDYYKKDKNFAEFRETVDKWQDLQCSRVTSCALECSNGDVSQLSENIAKFVSQCVRVHIKLKSCQFPNGVMHKYWITGEFLIRELRIDSGTLSEIELGSFESAVFNRTEKLELINVNLQRADENIFKGLNILEELVLSSMNQDFVSKINFLKYARSTLTSLAIETNKSTTAIKPQHLLGTEELLLIKLVNLSGNNFGNLIDKDSFNVIKRTKSLILQNCEITSIQTDVFDSMAKTIILLDLRHNRIKMLHPSYFKSLLPFDLRRILLSNNPVDCSCELSSFVQFYKHYQKSFAFYLMCETPTRNKGKHIKDAILCTDETTKIATTTTTTDSITSISKISRTTTEEPFPEVIKLHCTKNKSDDYLQIKSADVQFSVETISSTGVKLTVMKFQDEYSVLWFQNASMKFQAMEINYNDYALGCNTKIKREIIIENLRQAATYLFCLIKVGEIQISPFNCHSHHLQNDSENSVDNEEWYLWGSLSGTIAFIIVGAFLSIAFGGIFAFYIISWKPTLIKGSKRVLVVNKSSTDILIFPRSTNISGITTTTTNTTVTNDSVTFRNNRLCRSKSEGSIASSRSYMASSNLYEVIQYYQRIGAYEREKNSCDHAPNISAPPLPNSVSEVQRIAADEHDFNYNDREQYLKSVCML